MTRRSKNCIRNSTFDSISVDGVYVAFADNTDCIELQVHNASSHNILIQKGGAGAALVLESGDRVTLKGNPSDYACKRESGSGAVTVTAVIYTI